MNKKILVLLSQTRLAQFLHVAPTPRWITFSADFVIVAFCALLIFLLSPSNFGTSSVSLNFGYFTILIVYAAMNLLTGNYKCIVRFSVITDIFKSFTYATLSSLILCVISLGYSYFNPQHDLFLSIPAILIVGTISLCAMIMLRVMVKYFYYQISKFQHVRKPVIILGSSIKSISLANILRNEIDGQFEPKALLSLNKNLRYRNVNNLPIEIYNEKTVREIFDHYGANTLIFLQTHLELMRSGFADNFLHNHIQLQVLHQTEEFEMNKTRAEANISAHVNEIRIEDLLSRPAIKTENPLIQEQIHGHVVLISGSAGSIGSEIVRQVAEFGAGEIVLLDQAETPMHDIQIEMENKYPDIKIHLFIGNIQNYTRMEQAFRKYHPVFVYHAAAYKHVPMMERNPSEAILTNVMGTRNLADLSLKYGVRKFVMISTDKAVNPTNIMGASKRIAEIYVQSLFYHNNVSDNKGGRTKFITTRFGNVLGSNGSVIPLFRKQIEAGGPVTVTHKDIIRYFMTIQEACSLVLEAGCMGNGGEIYIFDMGKPVKIYELAKRMILLAGLRPEDDIKIIETGLRPGEKLYEELLNDKEKTLATINDKIMIAKVQKYNFTEINEQIEKLIRLASEGKIHDMVLTMKEIVPEFISNNSVFQKIDEEIKENITIQKDN